MTIVLRRAVVVVCMAGAVLGSFEARAETLRRVPLYRTGIQSDHVSKLVVRNVVGPSSSAPEIVACSNGSAFALSYGAPAYKTVWFTQRVNCVAVAAGDLDGDGATEVVIGTNEGSGKAGKLLVYTPRGFGGPRTTITIPGTVAVGDVAIGNADGDAGLEIVVATSANTYIYDAATLALDWTATGRGGTFVAIADLENDGVPEIVLNGSGDAQVLNGVTHAFKWGYVGGFGMTVAVGDIDGDGKAEIVGGDYSNVRVVQGDTLTTTTFTTGRAVQALAVGDGNNDGQGEIVVGDDQWGYVHGYTSAGTQLWTVYNPEHGVSGIAVGDVDGDGANEAVWGAGWTSSGKDAIFVGDPATHAVEWQTLDLDGPFYTAADDVDGDGDFELVFLTRASNSGYDGGIVEIHDLNGTVLASMQGGPNYYYDTTAMAVGQLDADPAKEIAILEANYSGARIHVFDGVTHVLEWSSPPGSYGSAGISGIAGMIVRNVDGDAVDEIIVSTTDDRIQVLNGASPIVQATTPPLDGDVRRLAIADLDADGVLDLVVGTYFGSYVLRMSDLSERIHTTMSDIAQVAATSGEFAILTSITGTPTVISYSGSTLLEQWRCPSTTSFVAADYTILGGTKWLATSDQKTLQLYPTGGASCPQTAAAEYALPEVDNLHFTDINGDGVPELLAGTYTYCEIDLIALGSAPRGDADNDGLVVDADMDAIARYYFGDGTIPAAGADVNGDSTLRADDLFYLINYRRGTGAAPPQ